MIKFCILALVGFTGTAFAAETEIRVRPGRTVSITCFYSGTTTDITGSSDELKLIRVGENVIKYEIYQDDYMVASCDNVLITGR